MTRISSPYRRYFSHPLSSLRSLGGLYIKLYVLRLYGKMWNVITLMWKTLNKLTLYSSKKPLCLSKYVLITRRYLNIFLNCISHHVHQLFFFLHPSYPMTEQQMQMCIYARSICNQHRLDYSIFYCTKKMNKWKGGPIFRSGTESGSSLSTPTEREQGRNCSRIRQLWLERKS